MKNVSIKLIISGLLILVLSCSVDDEPFPKQPAPLDWQQPPSGNYPCSFIAVVALPENINLYATENDLLAGFIGESCRGVGAIVKSASDGRYIFLITIRGTYTENTEIIFKYYNSRLSYLYAAEQKVKFEDGGNLGTYDTPFELKLLQIQN